MAQGMLVPACQSVLGHWVPPESRGRYFAFAMAGKFAGATIAMVTVPIIGKGRREGWGAGRIFPMLDDHRSGGIFVAYIVALYRCCAVRSIFLFKVHCIFFIIK